MLFLVKSPLYILSYQRKKKTWLLSGLLPISAFDHVLRSRNFFGVKVSKFYGESEYSLRFVNGTNKKRKKEKGHFKFFLTRARSFHPNSISRRALESACSN